MSQSQHTPGPWEHHPAPYGWDIWANTPEQFRQWIAPVSRLASPHSAIFDGSIEVDRETCEANARLIAAAPDLLAALKAAVDAYEAGSGRWVQSAYAAIAKVEAA